MTYLRDCCGVVGHQTAGAQVDELAAERRRRFLPVRVSVPASGSDHAPGEFGLADARLHRRSLHHDLPPVQVGAVLQGQPGEACRRRPGRRQRRVQSTQVLRVPHGRRPPAADRRQVGGRRERLRGRLRPDGVRRQPRVQAALPFLAVHHLCLRDPVPVARRTECVPRRRCPQVASAQSRPSTAELSPRARHGRRFAARLPAGRTRPPSKSLQEFAVPAECRRSSDFLREIHSLAPD